MGNQCNIIYVKPFFFYITLYRLAYVGGSGRPPIFFFLQNPHAYYVTQNSRLRPIITNRDVPSVDNDQTIFFCGLRNIIYYITNIVE